MQSISSNTCPRRGEHILKQEAAGTIVLLSLDGGQYYALDDSGACAWDLSDGTRTVAQIAAALSAEYDAPVATIESDLIDLFADLAKENLVTADAG